MVFRITFIILRPFLLFKQIEYPKTGHLKKKKRPTNWLSEHQRIDTFELWCWEKILESPLDCKEIQPVHPKGNQS